MQIVRSASASFAALTVAAFLGSVSASAQSASPAPLASDKSATVSSPSNESTPARFATLARVKAVPMSSSELDAVKGMHIHFTTPSQNAGHPHVAPFTGWHFVNHQENNLGNGNAPDISGPGYSGLCGAALNSPALAIPGQNPVTGVGGGCF